MVGGPADSAGLVLYKDQPRDLILDGLALNSMSCSPLWQVCDDLNSPKVK